MTQATGFTHRMVPGTDTSRPPLLLLHGTGGDENDLIDLGQAVSPGSTLISPRGKVSENGMPRFFRRLAEGVFDEADLRLRTNELADFTEAAVAANGLPAPIALGFSNGANIAAAMLLLRPESLSGAVLIRAMAPLAEMPAPDLSGKRILILAGGLDRMIPAESSRRLSQHLSECGATVEFHELPAGHGLIQADLRLATAFLA